MNNYIDQICFLLEIFCDYCLALSITKLRFKDMRHPFVAGICYFISGSLLTTIFPNVLGWILLSFCFLFLLLYILRTTFFKAFMVYIFITIPIDIIEFLLLIVISRYSSFNESYSSLIGAAATVIIVFISCLIIPFNRIIHALLEGSAFPKFLLIHLFILDTIVWGMAKYTTNNIIKYIPFIAAFAILVIITDIVILRQQQTITKQQHDLDNYYTYKPMMSELINDIRSKQHDFNNEIAAIRMLPFSYKDYDSLRDALINCSDLVISEYKEADLLKINLTVVAGFIHSKIIQADKIGKQINVTIHEHTLKSQMPEYELIRVIGILVDNALEAISQGDSISLHLASKENKITITTLNEGPQLSQELRHNMFTRGYTTKTVDRKHHGQGLPNLKKLVDQYDGRIYIENSYNVGKTFVKIEVVV